MTAYLIRRLITTIVTTWIIGTLIFFMIHILPGDPALLILSSMDESPSPEAVEVMRHRLGLDVPVHIQYAHWFTSVLKGDLGTSIMTERPVSEDLRMRLPRTLSLVVFALPLAVLFGVPLGVLAATQRETVWDPMITAFALFWVSTPVFVSGLLFVLLFAIKLHWLPTGGYTAITDNPLTFARQAFLPVLSLMLGPMATTTRMTRSSVLEVIRLDYVRTAWAKGLSYRVVLYRHVLRNALIPVVTLVGLSLGAMFGGSVMIEAIYTWPGLSSFLLRAVSHRDYPQVQGAILVIALGFIAANLLTDISYAFLDPRIRYD